MTARYLFTATAASVAVLSITPAYAADGQEMTYESGDYEFAQPAPPAPPPVMYRSEPVVQAVPAPEPAHAYHAAPTVRGVEYETEYETVRHAPPHHATYPAPHAGHGAHAAQQMSVAPPPLPQGFDRDEWLDTCEDRIRGTSGRSRGGIIGGLLGAITGGIIGNRVWDSERLAGTLIGGGIGGLAGLAIGSAIGGSGRDRDRRECAAYLDRWMSGGYRYGHGYGYGHQGYYGHGYYQQVHYVPVTVVIPQRAIVREYVTVEEHVEHVPTPQPPVHRPAPAPRPDKRIRYIKR